MARAMGVQDSLLRQRVCSPQVRCEQQDLPRHCGLISDTGGSGQVAGGAYLHSTTPMNTTASKLQAHLAQFVDSMQIRPHQRFRNDRLAPGSLQQIEDRRIVPSHLDAERELLSHSIRKHSIMKALQARHSLACTAQYTSELRHCLRTLHNRRHARRTCSVCRWFACSTCVTRALSSCTPMHQETSHLRKAPAARAARC